MFLSCWTYIVICLTFYCRYFFAEVFDFFRNFFLIVFHGNILFMILPLAIRLKHRPYFMAFVYIAISSMLKSYPSVSSLLFDLSLIFTRIRGFLVQFDPKILQKLSFYFSRTLNKKWGQLTILGMGNDYYLYILLTKYWNTWKEHQGLLASRAPSQFGNLILPSFGIWSCMSSFKLG